jgi:DNA-binding LacI/PurR family transcriptional regulator
VVDPASEAGPAAQIRRHYALLIADGRLKEGRPLPAVRALASRTGASINTVRAAYARLEADGLVATRQGVGTVVLPVRLAEVAGSREASLGAGTIGVVAAGLNPFYLPVLQGIVAGADRVGAVVLVATAEDQPDRAALAVRQMTARGVRGFIVLSAEVDRVPEALVPVVGFDRPRRTGYGIDLDAEAAGRLLGEHLAGHGHRRVGLITAPVKWPNMSGLPVGLRAGLGGGNDALAIAEVAGFFAEHGRAGLAALLGGPEPPTAVVGAGAMLCVGVLEEAASRGLRVPADLALAGYADVDLAGFVAPPLTMIGFPVREAGEQAAAMLLALLEGKRVTPRRRRLAPELRVRASCGCGQPGAGRG